MKPETRKAKREIIEARKAKMSDAQIARYKELAVTRYERIKYSQEYLGTLLEKANEYVVDRAEKGKPLTMAGFQRALGIPETSWRMMRNGGCDHVLYEFLALNDLPEDYVDNLDGQMIYNGVPLITYSEFVNGLYLRQQEMLEEACINKQNPVGSIYLMKALHGHSDNSGVMIQNNTLNVSTEKLGTLSEIENARRMLG